MRLAGLLALVAVAASAQQRVDQSYTPKVRSPAYPANGPVVAVDQAHNDFHTLGDKYAPFGKLLTADGYRVEPFTTPFTAQSLAGVNVLVIANARLTGTETSAFTPAEIAAVRQWVENGGSLFLIADHAPFGSAAFHLAEAFGVNLGLGYVAAPDGRVLSTQITYRWHDLGKHPILEGRDRSERVGMVESFTGESLSVPSGAAPLLLLPPKSLEVEGPDQLRALNHGESVLARSAKGRAQAVALEVGRGRVVVAGEAAMFTEQVIPELGRVGLTVDDDQQFALNILHWLSRALP
jgi:hypothetical protein